MQYVRKMTLWFIVAVFVIGIMPLLTAVSAQERELTSGVEIMLQDVSVTDEMVRGILVVRTNTALSDAVLGIESSSGIWTFTGNWKLGGFGTRVFETALASLEPGESLVPFEFPKPHSNTTEPAIIRLSLTPAMQHASASVQAETYQLYYQVTAGRNAPQVGEYTLADRKTAAHRTRRIIYNNDGNDNPAEPVSPITFLERRTTGLEKTQVDTISYSTGIFNMYTHSSDETELSYSVGTTEPGQIPWALYLQQQGFDPLQLMIDYGQANGIEVWWSMRMNDTHDNQAKREAWQLSQWKRDHRHLLMHPVRTQSPYGWMSGPSWTYSAVNYEHQEVRDKVFAIVEDVVTRYDLDGIELDFFRHPVFFKNQMLGHPVTDEQRALMTDLMVRIRDLTESVAQKRGRPFLIAIRVPDSVGYSMEIGLDIVAWLESDLVDILIMTDLFRLEPWETSVALGKQYDVPVYASLSRTRLPDDIRVWREEALQAWDAGVDGIYTFNVFQPSSPFFRELGSPEILRNLPRTGVYESNEEIMRNVTSIATFVKGGVKYLHPDVVGIYPKDVVDALYAID